jgi:hypothetical protein
MADNGEYLDVAGLTVLLAGGLRETGNPWMPFELADADGCVVAPAAAYLRDVQVLRVTEDADEGGTGGADVWVQ